MPDTKSPQHRYPAELRERASRMVQETVEQRKERHGAVTRVAKQLGIGTEFLTAVHQLTTEVHSINEAQTAILEQLRGATTQSQYGLSR